MVTGMVSQHRRNLEKREYFRKYMEEYDKNPEHKKRARERVKKLQHERGTTKSACTILKKHHEAMKDDPEHLTTEFIKKLIKVDCKEV